jgi:hypothetical protein
MAQEMSSRQNIAAIARADTPVLETLAQMSIHTMEHSGLDAETYVLVRLAALAAMDAGAASYGLNLGAARELGVPLEKVQGTLIAIAPLIGGARVVSAASKMLRALEPGCNQALHEHRDEDEDVEEEGEDVEEENEDEEEENEDEGFFDLRTRAGQY